MKKRVTNYLLVFLLIGFASYKAQTTYTWTGATNSSFTTSSNWSPAGPPTAADDAEFSGAVNCTIDDDIVIRNISILSSYSGTLDAGSQAIFISGNLDQAGGTFISTSTILEIEGNISFTGGTFNHNGGSVIMYVSPGITSSINGSINFNELTISPSTGASTTQRIINMGTASAEDVILSGSAPFNYQGRINVLNSLSINGSNTSTLSSNTGTFVFSGSGPITITGASGNTRNRLPNIEVNTTGTISATGHINVTGNWAGTQGTWDPGSSTVNFSGASASVLGANAAFDNLVVLSGSTLSLPAGQEVKVAGTITRTGGLTIPATTILGLNGTGAQSLTGTAYTLAGLRLYNTGGSRNVTLSTTVNITDFVEVQGNVTLASGSGNLVLKASSSGSGRVQSLQSGGTVSGTVTVETFLPGGSTGWANLGVRGVSGQTVKSWDTYVSSGGANGVPMTCNGCDYDENSLGSYFVSIQSYIEATGSYGELVATDNLTPGQGFWTYVGTGASSSGDLLLINSGPLVQGLQNVPVSKSGTPDGTTGNYYNLVANPYASPVLWSNVYNNNPTGFLDFEDAIYAWNADLVGGTGDFAAYSIGSNISTGGLTDEIPGGQGFYVGVTSIGTASFLEFHEIDKVSTSGNTPVLKPAAANQSSYFRLKLTGPYSEQAETVINVHPNATSFYDNRYDAHKMFMTPGYLGYEGPYTKYTTISTKDASNDDYAINSIPPLTQSVSIPVLAKVAYSGSFNISASDFQNFNPDVCIGLIDKLDNSYHDLRSGAYSFTINDTTSTPRFDLILCRDNSISTVGVPEEQALASNVKIGQNQDGAYVHTSFPIHTKATISAYNLMGQKIMEDVKIEGTTTSTKLNLNTHGQVVFITVNTAEGSTRKKMLLN